MLKYKKVNTPKYWLMDLSSVLQNVGVGTSWRKYLKGNDYQWWWGYMFKCYICLNGTHT